MDKIILGILMLKRHTVYEIRSIIRVNFKSMCSDSLGSIQAAMKRLLVAQMVTYSEYVEKGVNKKQYSITDIGRKALMDWLQSPAEMANSKNMDLGKLLFMGLVPSNKRLELIDGILEGLEAELAALCELWQSIQGRIEGGTEQALEVWMNDPEYLEGVLNATQSPNAAESAADIAAYELYTLQYGIDSLQFNVGWFRALREKAEKPTGDLCSILGTDKHEPRAVIGTRPER